MKAGCHLRRPLHCRFLRRLLGIAEVLGGIDQCDMGQRLGEISGFAPPGNRILPPANPDRSRPRPRARTAPAPLRPRRPAHGVGKPKGAGENAPSIGLRFIRDLAGIVPQHKPVAHHVFFDRRDGAAHARVRRRQEAHRRQQQDAGVEQLRAVGLDERILLVIKARFRRHRGRWRRARPASDRAAP